MSGGAAAILQPCSGNHMDEEERRESRREPEGQRGTCTQYGGEGEGEKDREKREPCMSPTTLSGGWLLWEAPVWAPLSWALCHRRLNRGEEALLDPWAGQKAILALGGVHF